MHRALPLTPRRGDRALARGVALAAALAAAALAGCGDGATISAPTTPASSVPAVAVPAATAERVARAYVRRRYRLPATGRVTVLRSRRDPRWILVDGGSGRRLWAVWLRGQDVVVAAAHPRRMNPSRVPCDLRPAFSEPSC